MSLGTLLVRLVPALDKMQAPYMVTGSVASSAHGLPRSTLDLDIVIAPTQTQLLTLMSQFPPDFYYADEQQALQALAKQSQFNIIDFATGWKVDFIIARDSPYAQSALSRRMRIEVDGTSVFVASPEDVVIAKLQWAKLGSSERQLQDVAGILKSQRGQLDTVYIQHWVSELQLQEQWQSVGQKID